MKFDSLTLALGAATVVLAAVAVSLSTGAGQDIDWLPAGEAREATPTAGPAALPALPAQALTLTWQQSMFSPDRKPDLVTGKSQASSLDGISLSGVIIDGASQWVLLQLPQKRRLKLAVGSTLDNGWTLESVTPQQAVFSHQGQTRELRLPLLRLPPPSNVPPITLPNVPTP
ncbi:general secretion pathway protein GspN [Pseudomonas petrae]|uniref:General secretion pathway protein GspN n=1 Tax=Pseudomonas petrae TaxID=2912190 RepID=A0ABS9I602_9PSED|nr:general secretion pathway protein GspN [Pseudomonas petrae]MCF7532962.1 general secretion pathway protein GspN [Pseudomonas petrae]MCF7535682.1 general secretion pathway protein GspN [Pseudomonas petrae]MCF7543208.1 general secretion pathway protein GspN [Pseudomonas petrae]MCF7554744.1 general secretion pathway protein GspN [Pseudomonas petrae]